MASDDESVLTEYDELEYEGEEPNLGQKKEYTLQNTLKPPRATTYTTQALYEQIHSGDVELNPEYQRDVVWPDEKQIKLIDSILRNFYIPPVIFAYRVEDDGTELRTCIDGKQRLTSIHKFMDGLIPHKDCYTNQAFWFKDNGDGRKGKKTILPEKLRKVFCTKQIVCVEYIDLRDSDERDIFKRVQLGVALTAAEKMNVIATPRADFVRLLMERYLTADKLGDPEIPWSKARGTDFKCLASSLFCLARPEQSTWSGTVQVENWLAERKGDASRATKRKLGKKKRLDDDGDEDGDYDDAEGMPVPDGYRKKVIETFEVMVELANNKKYKQAFRSSKAADNISPIEWSGIPILIYHVYVSPPSCSPARGDDRISLQRLSDLILMMRAYLHKTHKDVRQNARVGKDMLQFCLDASKDPDQFFQQHSDLLGWTAPPKAKRVFATSAASNKRKKTDKNESGEDDGGEYLAVKRTRSSVTQGARKSTGGKPPPTPLTSGPSSTSTRKSPPNPQMLPSPDPTTAPSSTVKNEPDPLTQPTSQMPLFTTDTPFKEWYQRGMMAGPGVPVDPTMMAFLGSPQVYQYMAQQQPSGSGGNGSRPGPG
ncbi:hypothetical protein L218DRAFT_956938 [Marasmius fiardii PR-910]|nr:hypothetical protein L218DRAFT_956938 [Marasmius fiardii PR-910]